MELADFAETLTHNAYSGFYSSRLIGAHRALNIGGSDDQVRR